ncbi:type II secretion system F family protein [Trinickia dinghuensis]|uniref:Pilus assembly protein n=1 Tax=Trinickia dinghuensis TaxID=2291023 RepID=A0A3D8K4A4_9BURK|nr:type II secretion system F family protein [Trinickia dinghuensis]RDU99694.1 pilus assembly protein [Trinickia dinghuensis]
MRPADVVAAGAFFAIVIAGLILRSLREMARKQPTRRIAERVGALRDSHAESRRTRSEKPSHQLVSFDRRRGDEQAWLAWLRAKRQRIETIAGRAGVRNIIAVALLAGLVDFVGGALAGLPLWARTLGALVSALIALRATYLIIIKRFKQRFLAVFPDTLDLIIRAVRAGIPAVQAICTAGVESEEPVRSTFRTMGDALLVGAEIKDVLEQAAERLQLADFSFFAVCLVLQRETGGNLAETLENLAAIVRTRRDIRAKTKALTAEGRISSKIISGVPFFIMGFLYLVNRPYITLLFDTRAGHKMLVLAAVLLTIGLSLIRKIANLDTSR